MKKINLLIILCFGLLWAQSTDELHKKLNTRYDGLQSFQAEVKQTNYFSQIKQSIVYHGKLYFSPGRMVMHFDKPNVQRLMVSSGNAELYDASSNTILRSKMLPEFGKMNPVEILQHYWSKSEVSIVSKDQNMTTLRLIPQKDPMIKELTAKIDTKSGLVHSLGYSDAASNTVSYEFSNIRTNQSIPASVWKFAYPKDVQVISQ
jgi:outer membrane lipoprotein-sorting protein